MTKKEIRQQIREITQQKKHDLPGLSNAVCQKILSSKIYKQSKIILAYSPLPDEVNILSVITDALQNGKKVFLPKIKPDCDVMDFFEFSDESQMMEGKYGILEPKEGGQKFEIGRWRDGVLEESDREEGELAAGARADAAGAQAGAAGVCSGGVLALVPGRAFSEDGSRVGRGKGFYDRYFGVGKGDVTLAGVCFPFQILSQVPVSQFDVKMDLLF